MLVDLPIGGAIVKVESQLLTTNREGGLGTASRAASALRDRTIVVRCGSLDFCEGLFAVFGKGFFDGS